MFRTHSATAGGLGAEGPEKKETVPHSSQGHWEAQSDPQIQGHRVAGGCPGSSLGDVRFIT